MKIVFLGTGAAEGIPSMGCACSHCRRAKREGGRLQRDRSAILVEFSGYRLLIDTPPRVRQLLGQYDITHINGVFLTHEHYDHSGGLNEFQYWPKPFDLITPSVVYDKLKRHEWGETLPEIAFYLPCRLGVCMPFDSFSLLPFQVEHTVPTFGLALYHENKKVVFASDSGPYFSRYARCLVRDADLLVINTPFFSQPDRFDHIDVQQALEVKDELRPQTLVLTHINHHNKPHDELEAFVSQYENVEVAYDGLVLTV